MSNKILCFLGLHKFEQRRAFKDPEIHIIERFCIHCGFSPTWER